MSSHGNGKGRKRQAATVSPNRVDLELQSAPRPGPQRRAAGTRAWTENRKRADELRQRERAKRLREQRRREPVGRTVRHRWRLVQRYHSRKGRGPEGWAAARTAQESRVSVSTVRRWARNYRQQGLAGLVSQPPGPHRLRPCVSLPIQLLVATLRRLLGWNEKRLAAELAARGIAHLSHTTIGRIFRRFHLPTRTYHAQARRAGLAQRRYAKAQPHDQWHLDFTQTSLADGRQAMIAVLLDDASRYCLACVRVPDTTTETAWTVVEQACARFSVRPQQLVTDNGRAFISVYCEVPTRFGRELRAAGIHHCRTSLYYPEGNGKVEAFIKILKHEALGTPPATAAELEQTLATFQTYYNFYRLHGSLGWTPPATRFWGLDPPQAHGLVGIPQLPLALSQAFSPAATFVPPPTDLATLKARLALVTLNC